MPWHVQVENFQLHDHIRVSHHMQSWNLELVNLHFKFLPDHAPRLPTMKNPSTSRIFLVHIEDVWKIFEVKLGRPIMSI